MGKTARDVMSGNTESVIGGYDLVGMVSQAGISMSLPEGQAGGLVQVISAAP